MHWTYKAKQNEDKIGPIRALVLMPEGKEEILENKGTHSPDGFQIGYGGSGPSDLAYSILIDYFLRMSVEEVKDKNEINLQEIKDKVNNLYQQFKNDFIIKEKELLLIGSKTITYWIKKNSI